MPRTPTSKISEGSLDRTDMPATQESACAETMPTMEKIAKHVGEIQRRQFGYAFGGPDPSWCEPSGGVDGPTPTFIELREDVQNLNSTARRFTGCRKYATCEFVPESARWTSWEALGPEDQKTLIANRCYRATNYRWNADKGEVIESVMSSWDPQTLPSRRMENSGGEWISNPFGVRTPELGAIGKVARNKESLARHRDFAPCAVGGCMTPEMERDYRWSLHLLNNGENVTEEVSDSTEHTTKEGESPDRAKFWATAKACPFFYRHLNSDLTEAAPNPERFTQCYVTLPDFREVLRRLGVIVAAPVFRSSNRTGLSGEAFWYPLYSGFSFLQLPSRSPTGEGWLDPTLPLRWHATARARQQQDKVLRPLPILKLFESIEVGENLTFAEKRTRVVTLSEGSATAFLLQWILIKRLKSAIQHQPGPYYDICNSLSWVYEQWDDVHRDGIVEKLSALGYDIETFLRVTIEEMKANDEDGDEITLFKALRHSSLEDDLILLGLIQSGEITERVQFTSAWLQVRKNRVETGLLNDYGAAWKQWIGKARRHIPENFGKSSLARQTLDLLSWLLLCSATDGLLSPPDDLEVGSLRRIHIADKAKALVLLETFAEGPESIFRRVCRLIPHLHILIRANWTAPVRWVFLPTGIETKSDQSDIELNNRVGVRVHSGIIALLEDRFQGGDYQVALSDDESELTKQLQLARAPLFTVGRIEAQHVRGELISAREWWDFQKESSTGFNHIITSIEKELRKVGTDSTLIIADMLDHLKTRLYMPPLPSRPVESKRTLSVELSELAKTSVQRVLASQELKRQSNIQDDQLNIHLILEGEGFGATVTPMENIYQHEAEDETRLRRLAEKGVLVFLNDLLLQRVTSNEREFKLIVRSARDSQDTHYVSVEVEIPSMFRIKELGTSRQKNIEFWKEGRGFYSTFYMAKSLGAYEWEVNNRPETNSGFIRIKFKRWEQ